MSPLPSEDGRNNDRAAALRRVFRHLKRGVFPPESIDDFTLGRKAQLAAISSRLGEVAGGASRHVFLEGGYGKGKSHMLKAIESIALRERFGVCWVTLDGRDHACNHPTRYLHAILESLRVPGTPVRGLSSLVKLWLGSSESESMVRWAVRSQCWLQYPILAYKRAPAQLEAFPALDAWIDCRDIVFRNGRLWFDTVSERLQATAGLLRAVGLNGVVFLFDELETVATLLPSIRQRFLSYEFLNSLVDARKHAHCYFAFGSTPDFELKLVLDSQHSTMYSEEYSGACRFIQKWRGALLERMQLSRLNKSDLLQLCKLLCAYHEQAFGWSLDERLSAEVLSAFVNQADQRNLGTREVVRAWVHLLELAEQHRDADLEMSLTFAQG